MVLLEIADGVIAIGFPEKLNMIGAVMSFSQ